MVRHIKRYNKETREEIIKRLNRSLYTESNKLYRDLVKITEKKLRAPLTEKEREGLKSSLSQYRKLSKQRFIKEKFITISMSLDTETTSIKDTELNIKYGFIYTWQVGLGGIVYYGRYIYELKELLDTINEIIEHEGLFICCLVQYLGFEFQFLRKYLKFSEVFSKGEREVLNYRYKNIYFKDTLAYYHRKLSNLGNKVDGFKYNMVRHSKTPLTNKELKYIRNDCLILNDLWREELKTKSIEDYLGVKTAISSVKQRLAGDFLIMKRALKKNPKSNTALSQWCYLIKNSKLDIKSYSMLKAAYWGGYNHTGLKYRFKTVEDVASYDITSAYISVICSKTYPYGEGEYVFKKLYEDFPYFKAMYNKLLKDKESKYIVEVELIDVNLRVGKADNILAAVNVQEIEGEFIKDRHIVSADRIKLTCTLEDLQSILLFYSIDENESSFKEVLKFKAYPLPPFVVKRCLELFKQKQELKGKEDKREEYERVKTLVCSIYGLLGTDPIRKKYSFTEEGEAEKLEQTEEEQLNRYNSNYNRFGFYGWAIWVAAYVRQVIISFIDKIGGDFVYSDTDSIKFKNKEKYEHLFSEYNDIIGAEIKGLLTYYGIDIKLAEGNGKFLGWFLDETREGNYKYFKSLGCKQYIYYNSEGALKCTVAGIKEEAIKEFLLHIDINEETDEVKRVNREPKEVLKLFSIGLLIPAEFSNCLAAYYQDNEVKGEITDYTGITDKIDSKSSICLYNTPFCLGSSYLAAQALDNFEEYRFIE